jgi:hypothetical protein
MEKQRPFRGLGVLALAGLGAAVLAAGPVTAASEDKLSGKEKKKVIKIASQQATSLLNAAVGGAAVTDTDVRDLNSPNLDAPSAVIATLPLQAGSYIAGATFEAQKAEVGVFVECALRNGGDQGPAIRSTQGESSEMGSVSLATNGPGTVELRCTDTTTGFASGGAVADSTVWAIEVPTLTETTA